MKDEAYTEGLTLLPEGEVIIPAGSNKNNLVLDVELSNKIVFAGVEFNEKDFEELKKIINERREEMYSLYRIYFVNRETLEFNMAVGIGKTEVSAVNDAHKKSFFDKIDLDNLTYKTEFILNFKKKIKLKEAVDTINEELD